MVLDDNKMSAYTQSMSDFKLSVFGFVAQIDQIVN